MACPGAGGQDLSDLCHLARLRLQLPKGILMPVPIESLPPEVAQRVRAQAGVTPKRRPGAVAATEAGLPVRCATCGEPADGDTAQRHHLAATGHRRYACVLT